MIVERGIPADHSTIYRWAMRYSRDLLPRFNLRKRVITGRESAWRLDADTHDKLLKALLHQLGTAMTSSACVVALKGGTWRRPLRWTHSLWV